MRICDEALSSVLPRWLSVRLWRFLAQSISLQLCRFLLYCTSPALSSIGLALFCTLLQAISALYFLHSRDAPSPPVDSYSLSIPYSHIPYFPSRHLSPSAWFLLFLHSSCNLPVAFRLDRGSRKTSHALSAVLYCSFACSFPSISASVSAMVACFLHFFSPCALPLFSDNPTASLRHHSSSIYIF